MKSWRILALLLLALAMAGCGGGDSGTVGSPVQPQPSTGTITVTHVLARAVPSSVTDFRFLGYDSNGNLAYGPDRRPKAAVIALVVPATVVDLTIEYLQGNTVVGLYQAPIALVVGGNVDILDPPWVDVQSPGVAARLGFTVQPVNGAPNTALPAVQVSILDSQGNVVPTATHAISLALGHNPAGGILSGTLTRQPVNGVATFDDLALDKGGNYTLVATAASLQSAASDAFTISPQPVATSLRFVTQPPDGTAGTALNPAVEVEVLDQFGARFPVAAGLTALLGANPSGSSLSGGATTTAAGLGTFSSLVVAKAGTGYTLVVTGLGLAPVTSLPFGISVVPLVFDYSRLSVGVALQALPSSITNAAMVSADFDLNGLPDLAVALPTLNEVRIFRTRPDGSVLRDVLSLNSVTVLQAGDVNLDGFADLVTLSPSTSTKSVVLGNGDGTFQAAVASTVPADSRHFAMGDLTGEGLPDLAVVGYSGSSTNTRVSLYQNTGGGFGNTVNLTLQAFQPGNPLPAGGATAAAIGQLNASGALDVAVLVGGTPAKVALLLDYTAGTPGAFGQVLHNTTVPAIPTVGGSMALALGNFDGLNGPDLAALGTASVSVLLHGGGTTWTLDSTYAVQNAVNSNTNLAAADVDGVDALDEILYLGSDDSVRVLRHNAAAPPLFDAATVRSQTPVSPRCFVPVFLGGTAHVDVAVVNNSGANTLSLGTGLLGRGDGSFGPDPIGDGDYRVNETVVADVNTDGIPDLVVGTNLLDVRIYLGQAGGVYPTAPDVVVNGGGTPFASMGGLGVGDFNGDGFADLVASDTLGAGVRFFQGDGALLPAFVEPPGSAVVLPGGAAFPGRLEVGNLDTDVFSEVVVLSTTTAEVFTLQNTGTYPLTPVATSVLSTPGAMVLASLDDDSDLDVGVRGSGAVIQALLNDGTGTFPDRTAFALPPTNNAQRMDAGDVNGDGHPDLVVTCTPVTTQVYVLLGDGAGGFPGTLSVISPTLASAAEVAVADLNGDGLLDLALANENGAAMNLMLGLGTGVFQNGPIVMVGCKPFDVIVRDLDGDGRPDFVTGSRVAPGGVSVVLQQ